MNKFISLIATAALVLVNCLTASGQTSQLPKHQAVSFFNNYQWLMLSNNVTDTYNYTNQSVFNNVTLTNVLTLTTNANGNVVLPQWEKDLTVIPVDGNYVLSTNFIIAVKVNNTNIDMPQYSQVPYSWLDTNGNHSTNYPVPVIVPTSASTNTLTFTFRRATWGGNFGTGTLDTFTWAIAAPGVTSQTFTTGVPASFLAGTQRIRLESIAASAATSSPGCIINDVRWCGYGF